MSPHRPKTTIWIWPTGLFPRRIIYYLRAQNITLADLAAANIDLVPVLLDPESHQIRAKEGYAAKPDGMTVPCMYIAGGSGAGEGGGQWVRESVSIIAYLEEVFGEDGRRKSFYGTTAMQRLKTHDIMCTFSADIIPNYITELTHTVPGSKSWTHIQDGEISSGAGAHARRRKEFYLRRLEDWVRRDIVERGTRSLSGEGREVTLADVVVMAQVCYARDGYGADWLEGCGVLRNWSEEAVKGEWWVDGEKLKECEERGWNVVLKE